MSIDQDKLGELLGRFVTDIGATMAAGSVVVGHRLGLYRALGEASASAEQLAHRTGTGARSGTELRCRWMARGEGGATGRPVRFGAAAAVCSSAEFGRW